MLQPRSILNVADNCGVLTVKLIYTRSKSRFAKIGDLVVVVAKTLLPNLKSTYKKGTIYNGLIIRTKKGLARKDGTYLRFQDNAVVLLSPSSGQILGTHIHGSIPRELRAYSKSKLLTFADKIV